MSLFEDTNPKALKDLLGEINSRTKALHNFLGDFVWGEPVQTHGRTRSAFPRFESYQAASASL